MLYREHRPAPPLSRFVTCLWYCEGYTAHHTFEKVLPNGSVQIVINLDRPHITNYEWRSGHLVEIQRAPALITGVQTKPCSSTPATCAASSVSSSLRAALPPSSAYPRTNLRISTLI